MTDVVRDTNPDRPTLRERTQEINVEYWAARDKQSERVAVAQLGFQLAWAESSLAWAESELEAERVRREKAETALRGMVCETCGIGMWESREGFCDSCSEARAVLAGEGDARELERRLEESLGLGGEGDEPVR